MKILRLKLPIKVIPSSQYYLVIQDVIGTYHYFDEKGNYDGWSEKFESESVHKEQLISESFFRLPNKKTRRK